MAENTNQDNTFTYNRFAGLNPLAKLGLILSEGAMAFGEGLGGGKPYSNYMDMQAQQAKMAYEQWQQRQQMQQELPLKTAQTRYYNLQSDWLQTLNDIASGKVKSENLPDINVDSQGNIVAPGTPGAIPIKSLSKSGITFNLPDYNKSLSEMIDLYKAAPKGFLGIGKSPLVDVAENQILNYMNLIKRNKIPTYDLKTQKLQINKKTGEYRVVPKE